MNRLLVFAAFVAVTWAATVDGDNSTALVSATPLCVEFAECLHKAQQKAAECHALDNNNEQSSPEKNAACGEAKKLHHDIRNIHNQLSGQVETCVREKAETVMGLTEKKSERCQNILKKNAKRAAAEPQKRKNKKEKSTQKMLAKTCNKETRRLKTQCARLAKCCPAAKECHQAEDKTELEEKKKALKQAAKECSAKDSKKKKGRGNKKDDEPVKEREGKKRLGDNKKSLAKTLESAQKRRRATPIGGKKLAEALADMQQP